MIVGEVYDITAPSNFNKFISCPAFQLMALIVFIDIIVRAISDARKKKKDSRSIKVRKAMTSNLMEA